MGCGGPAYQECTLSSDVRDLANGKASQTLRVDELISRHGVPLSIVSDRDSRFHV